MSKSFEYNDHDPRTYQEQYEEWLLIVDTMEYDINTYPGRGDEQSTQVSRPEVVTKRDRRQ